MRLSQKLILFILAAAVVPLSFAGFWLLRQSERELSARLEGEQRAVARGVADGVSARLLSAINALSQSAGLIDWRAASPEEIEGGLRLLASQSPDVAAVMLVDSTRQPLLPPPVSGLEGHPAFRAGAQALATALPLESLSTFGDRGQVAVGAPQPGDAGPWLPVAIQVGPKGPAAPMLVVALGLAQLRPWLAERASGGLLVELADTEGRVAACSEGDASLAALEPGRAAVLKSLVELSRSASGERVALAPVAGGVGLTAVVSLPEATALAPVRALRRTVLGGLAGTALVLAAVALLFARGVASRVEKVAKVAGHYARGELGSRVEVGGADELTELAHTFNQMGAELEAARARLTRWNDELKQKVDEATAELRAAQATLIETQKLAAIGQLGAGVAHEINNPLSGILGNAQLLLLDHPTGDPDFSLLQQIEDSAKRCRDITQNLLRFSQTRGEVCLRGVELNQVVRAAMAFEAPRHEQAGVTVTLALAEQELRVDADPEQLEQVISQLCSNARTAMKDAAARALTVSTRAEGDEVLLTIQDTGKGITPENLERVFEPFFTTKDVWANIGLGLSVAYRIIEEHDGRIDVQSAPGQGASFTVRLKSEGRAQPRQPAERDASKMISGEGVGIVS